MAELRAAAQSSGKLTAANTPGVQVTNDPGAAFRDNVRASQQAIQLEQDPTARLALISELASDTQRRASEIGKAITERITNESNVGALKEELATYRAGGAGVLIGNLINKRFGGENTGTALRRSLEDERQQIMRKIKLEVAQNPDIASIQALHDTHGFLNTQSRLAISRINRTDSDELGDANRTGTIEARREDSKSRVDAARVTANINRDAGLANSKLLIDANKEVRAEERRLKKEEDRVRVLNAIQQDGMDLARVYSGKDINDTTIGDFVIHNLQNNKEFKEVMSAASDPDTVVDMAIEGNPVASSVAAKKQAELLSGSTDTTNDRYRKELSLAQDNIKMMKKIQVSAELQEQAATAVYGAKGTATRKTYDNTIASASLLGTKESFEFRSQKKRQLARDFLLTASRDQFSRDIDSWGEKFTGIMENNPMYAKLVQDKGKGKVAVQDMVNSISAIEDPIEKAKEMKVFQTVMEGAAAKKNAAYFGFAIDNLDVRSTLDRATVRTLRGDLQKHLPSLIQNASPFGAIDKLGKKAFEEIDEAFDIGTYLFGQD